MEESIRKTVPKRNTARPNRTKYIFNLKLFRKIMVQLVISILILFSILAIKNLDTPATNQLSKEIKNYLSENLTINQVTSWISYHAAEWFNNTKSIFKKAKPASSTPIPNATQNNDTKTPRPNTKPPASSDGTNAFVPSLLDPTSSGIDSLDMDVRQIRSKYKFKKPVAGQISSPFGIRINPITQREEFHPGVDIKTPKGTYIRAAISGEVVEARRGSTLGIFARIKTGNDIIVTYGHCSKLLIRKGQKVVKGQKIARAGSTGMSTGAHLHFEVSKDGRYVDPLYLLK
jgi:murein DD-endopeptidase MepM/ murein hydrolase activator NlpD